MSSFPVTSSILSANHLAQFLQKPYGFSQNVTCRLLKAGINHSYLVTDGPARMVFRVYSLDWRTEIEINEEIRLLNLLKESHLPVSYPVADVNGQYIHELIAPEGKRFGVLFSFANGEKLLTFPASIHFTIGQIMARLHLVTHELTLARTTYTSQVLLIDSLEKVKPFLSADTPEMQYLLNTQQYLLNELAAIDYRTIRQGVVHLDIWFDNLSIANDGTVTLFDFDFSGNGFLNLDIAYYIMQIYSTETDESEFLLKQHSFLQGYESIVKISDEEKRLIGILGASLYFFYIGVQCQRFDNWSNTFLNELHLKRLINLRIKRWLDFVATQPR